MSKQFEKSSFYARLKSMLKVDFKRMFTMPLVYIMSGICLVIPVLILVMTSKLGSEEGAAFTDVWQAIGSVGGAGASLDITGMCNINLVYFLIAIFACVFVADDFKSGYAKNIFAVRPKKTDYVISKTLVCFSGGVIMISAYFIGALLGGAIGGLSFETEGYGAGNITACLISKMFSVAIFASIALLLGVVAKQRLWLSILASLAAGMLLFTMLPMTSPIDSNFINIIMCLVGGAFFGFGLGAVSCVILNKTNLV
ncbi:MAG: ABC transporter permease [Clostridia bacterium]|nr:ABC transporter permease [Clostridia bacterium]